MLAAARACPALWSPCGDQIGRSSDRNRAAHGRWCRGSSRCRAGSTNNPFVWHEPMAAYAHTLTSWAAAGTGAGRPLDQLPRRAAIFENNPHASGWRRHPDVHGAWTASPHERPADDAAGPTASCRIGADRSMDQGRTWNDLGVCSTPPAGGLHRTTLRLGGGRLRPCSNHDGVPVSVLQSVRTRPVAQGVAVRACRGCSRRAGSALAVGTRRVLTPYPTSVRCETPTGDNYTIGTPWCPQRGLPRRQRAADVYGGTR